ncbi:tetratricopeptide repeat protein [Pseudoduganella namucuonensis]|uniref:Flp pilus assembly protein TadD, contains TPR repeats n=1 Tax=Pseudoduganella namucuonensis TaxID=1035707 RepID=A0A1I7FFI0_9BURK|nr:tetratricopeptide repeat protein [Pseudoduganella namucuonensis]SFU34952.1 Flp pilus assembly protein TadD, contains TPR repeats [Pseudoduganella namucuonensis]
MNDTIALSAHDYRVRIEGLIERRRFSQASALLGEALANFPDDSELLHSAATIDYHNENHEASLHTLQQLLVRAPKHLNGRYLLVGVHEAREDWPQAEAVLLDLLHDYPESSPLYARYAMLMYRTQQIDKAMELAREALRLDPEDDGALAATMIGDLIDGRKGDERNSLAALMMKHPEDMVTARLLIVHLINRGRYWSAKRIAIELLKARPDSREALELVVEIEALCHWSVVPLWPLNRWGTAATITLWIGWILVYKLLRSYAPQVSDIAATLILAYCVYSWVYPFLLRRWLKRRAGL